METGLERILTNSHKAEMISFVTDHPASIKELIKLSIVNKQPYSWRAAWLLWGCMKENDLRIRKHVKVLINVLPERKDNQQREILKILQQMEIKEELEGALFNHCLTVWINTNKQPSVRFNALKVLTKIARRHPELSKEIIALTQYQYTDCLSSAVNRSLNKMIKGMEVNTIAVEN